MASMEMHLEQSQTGEVIGRDPRTMSEDDLRLLGHEGGPLLAAIRARCLDCCAGSVAEVRSCVSGTCALWPYRMNKNPFRRREMTDEQREAAAERLRAAREGKASEVNWLGKD